MPRSIQQQTVIDWTANGRGNAFVTAVAGAGKTTTLIDVIEQAMAANPRNSIAYAAFNKAIADEVKAKLEKRNLMTRQVTVGTFHSFGWRAWRKAHPACKLDLDLPKDLQKWTRIWDDMIQNYMDRSEASFDTATAYLKPVWPVVKKLVSFAKAAAMRPEQFGDLSVWKGFVTHYRLDEEIESPELMERAVACARVAMVKSVKLGSEVADFDDMLYLPVIHGTPVWTHDWLLVDEAQDTNPVRLALATMLVKPRWGRAIFVGDPRQAIYGFSGADAAAVQTIRDQFRTTDLPLTVTFRCPKAIVREANKYVSHIQAADTAPEGTVLRGDYNAFMAPDSLRNLTKDDAILCRKTAPLVDMAYQFLSRGIGCHVEGKDIGGNMKTLLRRWKVKNVDVFRAKLDSWSHATVSKLLARGDEMGAEAVQDQTKSLLIICEGCHEIEEVIAKIDALFKDGEPSLTLATVHRSKGREWERVFILGENRWMPHPMAKAEWEQEQEENLIYVAITRAQDTLIYVDVPYED